MTSPIGAAETQLVVPLTLNEVERGEVSVVIDGEDLFVPVAALESAGTTGVMWQRVQFVSRLRRGLRIIDGVEAISLKALTPWATYKFDEANLSLSVTVDPRLLMATDLTLQSPRPKDLVYSKDPSSFFNYAVSSPGLSEVSVFGEIGQSIRGNLLYSTLSRTPENGVVRGTTNFTVDQRSALRRWTVGDSTVFSDELGGSGFVGGVTLTRSFELDPYFVRYPSLNLGGTALTPSQVEIYVNGMLVDRRTVPPGPFEIRNIPGAAGMSNAQIVVRDAFGREQSRGSRFYYSTSILSRGLSEYVYSGGYTRNNFITSSFDYDDPVLVAYHRKGLTDHFTAGGRIEAGEHFVSGGPTMAFATGVGEVELKVAGSESNGTSGVAGQIGFRRLSRRANFGGTVKLVSRKYANFSLRPEDDRSLRETQIFTSYLPRWGNIGLQWSTSDLRDSTDRDRLALLTNVSITSSASLLFSIASVSEDGERSGEFFAGVSFRIGQTSTANVAFDHRDGENSLTAEIQRPLPLGTGYGYRLQTLSTRSDTSGSSALQYQNDYGRYEVAFDPFDVRDPLLTASGGMIYQEGAFMLSRPVDQSYALVRVNGIEGVRVYSSNQLIGRTNTRGDLLVPNLLPYYGNRLRIDDRDVPLEYDVQAVEKTIAPPFRGGAFVDFTVRQVRTVTGSIVIKVNGADVPPAYGQITLGSGDNAPVSPLGALGEFYFENIAAGVYDAVTEYAGGTCTSKLEIPATKTDVIKLGLLTCEQGTAAKP